MASKIAQLVAKIAQDSFQEPPTRPPRLQKTNKSDGGFVVFTLLHFLQRSPPRPPKVPKIAPQLASRWPPKPHLGSSWRHLGPILAPTLPKSATQDAPRPPQDDPKMPQHRAKTPQDRPKIAPRSPQDAPAQGQDDPRRPKSTPRPPKA